MEEVNPTPFISRARRAHERSMASPNPGSDVAQILALNNLTFAVLEVANRIGAPKSDDVERTKHSTTRQRRHWSLLRKKKSQ